MVYFVPFSPWGFIPGHLCFVPRGAAVGSASGPRTFLVALGGMLASFLVLEHWNEYSAKYFQPVFIIHSSINISRLTKGRCRKELLVGSL